MSMITSRESVYSSVVDAGLAGDINNTEGHEREAYHGDVDDDPYLHSAS
jgi:hypothetical protein